MFLTIGESSQYNNESNRSCSTWKDLNSPGFSADDLRNTAKPEYLLKQTAPLMITQVFKLKDEKDSHQKSNVSHRKCLNK